MKSWPNASGTVRAETVTAIAATVTAVAALSIAVWDNIQTRSYNRVSVQPHLVIEFAKHQGPTGDSGTLVLRNEGIGPAQIEGITIQLVDREGTPRSYGSWNEARSAIRAENLLVTGYTDLTDSSVLGIERTMELLSVQSEPEGGSEDPVQSLINRLSVTIRYTSVWDAPYQTTWPGGP